MEPQNFAAQISGVASGTRGIPAATAGSIIGRGKAVRFEGVGVITHGEKKISISIECQGPTRMAADVPVDGHAEQHLLRSEIEPVSLQHKPAEPVLADIFVRGGVVEINPMVLRKVWI